MNDSESELERLKSLVRVYLVEDFNHDCRACTEKGCEDCDSVSRKREELERMLFSEYIVFYREEDKNAFYPMLPTDEILYQTTGEWLIVGCGGKFGKHSTYRRKKDSSEPLTP